MHNISNDIKLIVHNIRFLSKHFDDLSIFLDSLKNFEPDVIILTETWLSEDFLKYYTIEGYIAYIAQRADGTRSGGVVTYIKNKISHSHVLHSNQYFQAVQLKIESKFCRTPNLKQIEIIGLYGDTRKPQIKFIEEIDHLFLNRLSQNLVITGDFNINLFSDESHYLLNKLSIAGLKSLINEPTRRGINKHGQTVETCLDHLYVRSVDASASAVWTGNSDHVVIKACVHFKLLGNHQNPNNDQQQQQYKTFNYTNWDKFGKLLAKEGWNNLNLTTVDDL